MSSECIGCGWIEKRMLTVQRINTVHVYTRLEVMGKPNYTNENGNDMYSGSLAQTL